MSLDFSLPDELKAYFATDRADAEQYPPLERLSETTHYRTGSGRTDWAVIDRQDVLSVIDERRCLNLLVNRIRESYSDVVGGNVDGLSNWIRFFSIGDVSAGFVGKGRNYRAMVRCLDNMICNTLHYDEEVQSLMPGLASSTPREVQRLFSEAVQLCLAKVEKWAATAKLPHLVLKKRQDGSWAKHAIEDKAESSRLNITKQFMDVDYDASRLYECALLEAPSSPSEKAPPESTPKLAAAEPRAVNVALVRQALREGSETVSSYLACLARAYGLHGDPVPSDLQILMADAVVPNDEQKSDFVAGLKGVREFMNSEWDRRDLILPRQPGYFEFLEGRQISLTVRRQGGQRAARIVLYGIRENQDGKDYHGAYMMLLGIRPGSVGDVQTALTEYFNPSAGKKVVIDLTLTGPDAVQMLKTIPAPELTCERWLPRVATVGSYKGSTRWKPQTTLDPGHKFEIVPSDGKWTINVPIRTGYVVGMGVWDVPAATEEEEEESYYELTASVVQFQHKSASSPSIIKKLVVRAKCGANPKQCFLRLRTLAGDTRCVDEIEARIWDVQNEVATENNAVFTNVVRWGSSSDGVVSGGAFALGDLESRKITRVSEDELGIFWESWSVGAVISPLGALWQWRPGSDDVKADAYLTPEYAPGSLKMAGAGDTGILTPLDAVIIRQFYENHSGTRLPELTASGFVRWTDGETFMKVNAVPNQRWRCADVSEDKFLKQTASESAAISLKITEWTMLPERFTYKSGGTGGPPVLMESEKDVKGHKWPFGLRNVIQKYNDRKPVMSTVMFPMKQESSEPPALEGKLIAAMMEQETKYYNYYIIVLRQPLKLELNTGEQAYVADVKYRLAFPRYTKEKHTVVEQLSVQAIYEQITSEEP